MTRVPIRLQDVPYHVRMAAARRLMAQDPNHAVDFALAALTPSGTTYMVDETEAMRVCGTAAPAVTLLTEPQSRVSASLTTLPTDPKYGQAA